MKFSFFGSTAIASIFSFSTVGAQGAITQDRRRLNVRPGQSIAAEVRANGSTPGQPFHLIAETAGGGPNFEIDVRVALPAVTEQTTTSVMGGESMPVDLDSLATILVSDSDDDDDTVALIAVQGDGDVNGIVQRGGGKGMKFTQRGGRNVSSLFFDRTGFIELGAKNDDGPSLMWPFHFLC